MADFKVTPQDTISFLQDYINAINEEIDEILAGQNINRELKSIKLRIELLERDDEKRFSERIKELKEELKKFEEECNRLNPLIERLEAERSYYRQLLNEISR